MSYYLIRRNGQLALHGPNEPELSEYVAGPFSDGDEAVDELRRRQTRERRVGEAIAMGWAALAMWITFALVQMAHAGSYITESIPVPPCETCTKPGPVHISPAEESDAHFAWSDGYVCPAPCID